MNVEIKSVHFALEDEHRELIEKKMHKIDFAQGMIVDFLFTATKEKSYVLDTTVNMRWGASHHFRVEDFDLRDGVDKLFDKIDHKISKEKDRIKSH